MPIRDRVLRAHIEWEDVLEEDPKTGQLVPNRRMHRTPVHPLREVIEVRLRPRYPTAGDLWALERWCPPKAYGTPRQWYSPTNMGGTMTFIKHKMMFVPSLGPYPFRGEYEYTNFSFTTLELAESTVLTAIGRIERHLENLPPPGVRVAFNTMMAQEEEEARDEAFTKYAGDMIEDLLPAFDGNPMSGYGPKRPHSSKEVAKRLGIKEHLGVD